MSHYTSYVTDNIGEIVEDRVSEQLEGLDKESLEQILNRITANSSDSIKNLERDIKALDEKAAHFASDVSKIIYELESSYKKELTSLKIELIALSARVESLVNKWHSSDLFHE